MVEYTSINFRFFFLKIQLYPSTQFLALLKLVREFTLNQDRSTNLTKTEVQILDFLNEVNHRKFTYTHFDSTQTFDFFFTNLSVFNIHEATMPGIYSCFLS